MLAGFVVLVGCRQVEPDSTGSLGEWERVVPVGGSGPNGDELGMQAVHAALLPSGKVLIGSGSSWRNGEDVPYNDPRFEVPPPPPPSELEGHRGLFVRDDNPFELTKKEGYFRAVNNTGIYDPETNTWSRIPHPPPQDDPLDPNLFAPNDMFCSGHLQLPDGDVLFVGGTELYFPYRTGLRSTFIFDWRRELEIDWSTVDWEAIPVDGDPDNPWTFSGFMPLGRWYPHMVPLLDGRLAIFGGFLGFEDWENSLGREPYRFEINTRVDFFDPEVFDPAAPGAAWRSVDAKGVANSPFDTLLDPGEQAACDPELGDECNDPIRNEDHRRDAFKLYPHNYLLEDGRIYMTREGEWVSLRTDSTAWMRRTRHTYFMTVGGDRANPTIAFEPGPDRPEIVTSYGTTFRDPSSGDIVVLGGQDASRGDRVQYDPNSPDLLRFAGGRASRRLERYTPEPDGPGQWTLEPEFLGDSSDDDRTMHYALVLPNKEILVINGGNYDFFGGVRDPILLTSDGDGFRQSRLEPAEDQRLYHNTALLLPDGRVLTIGGNAARATFNRTTGEVERDVYFLIDGYMSKVPSDATLDVPTEQWTAELFSPPYLAIDPDRRAEIVALSRPDGANDDYTLETNIGGKRFYLLHSDSSYELSLADLPERCEEGSGPSLALIKLGSSTHGWDSGQRFIAIELGDASGTATTLPFVTPNAQADAIAPGFYMLFYVDCRGKPSVAQMVRFDDRVTEL
jgi:hypothetical protein